MKPFKGYFRRITTALDKTIEVHNKVKPFESMPGPKPLPLIGNLWRYFPVIGKISYAVYVKLMSDLSVSTFYYGRSFNGRIINISVFIDSFLLI